MSITRRMLVVLLVGGLFFSLVAAAQVPPPNTGKMSWGLFQTVTAGQRKRAVGEEVPVVSALFLTASPVTPQDLATLKEKGYTILGAFGQFVMVEAPADHYADPQKGVNVIDFVSNATLPPVTITSQTIPITNGTSAIGATRIWAHGYQGKGAKIAVIDVGFNPDDSILAQFNPTFYSINPTGTGVGTYEAVKGKVAQESEHGTSCAIIAGDVAPKASLYLLSYPTDSGILGWLCALHYAVHTLKVDVVSTSVEFGYPTCHADGTGPLNQAVDQILSGSNTELVIAAGNWAQGSETDRTFYAGTFADSDGDYEHDFTTTASDAWDRDTLRFSAHEGDLVTIILEWDDWNANVKTTDLDLVLYDAKYRVPLAFSQAQQFGNETNPVEIIRGKLPYTGDYCLAVVDHAAKWDNQPVRPLSFHLNLFNQSKPFTAIEHHTTCGSVREVATNPTVITVGAISVKDGTVRPYSSRGPTAGGVNEPDIYAPDGITGTVYPAFYGTSASAPYAAGAIALVRSFVPNLSKGDLLTMLWHSSDGKSDTCGNFIHQLDLSAVAQK